MSMPYPSPLRYPGGKRKLSGFMKQLFRENRLLDGDYAEPYAGGASVALAVLYEECARCVHINDLDRSIYAFWHSVLYETDALCRLVRDTPVTIKEWHEQKAVQGAADVPLLELGFSTFFLNRTNRSGIIRGGVIGGKGQAGAWALDARYNKSDLILRVEKVARYAGRIRLYNLDAADFITSILPGIPVRSLVFLDPPYYVKGQQRLYTDFYEPPAHAGIAKLVKGIRQCWLISYDDVPEVRSLYEGYLSIGYTLHYNAQDRYRGAEVMFLCDRLALPSTVGKGKASAVRYDV